MVIRTAHTVLTALGVGLIISIVVSRAGAFPEPSIVSKAWQYELSYAPPRPIPVLGLGGRTHWYWYMTYKVVNNTGDERLFVPEVEVFTDAGKIFPAGRDVPAGVFNAVKARVENPLLENPAEIIGRILQGPDHAKEGVAIWPAPTEDVDHLSVFFAGLSGETHAISHPVSGERVVLRKTLMVEYEIPGTTSDIQHQPVVPKGERWIMR